MVRWEGAFQRLAIGWLVYNPRQVHQRVTSEPVMGDNENVACSTDVGS